MAKSTYCLSQKQIAKARDNIDKALKGKVKGNVYAWADINSLVADAYHRGKGKC